MLRTLPFQCIQYFLCKNMGPNELTHLSVVVVVTQVFIFNIQLFFLHFKAFFCSTYNGVLKSLKFFDTLKKSMFLWC